MGFVQRYNKRKLKRIDGNYIYRRTDMTRNWTMKRADNRMGVTRIDSTGRDSLMESHWRRLIILLSVDTVIHRQIQRSCKRSRKVKNVIDSPISTRIDCDVLRNRSLHALQGSI
jgi:siroheme synthase (precorrin-2 oxidase/ferrochelatase)